MSRKPAGALIPTLEGRTSDDLPLHVQLYRRVRGGILSGSLPTGTRLPSTRVLAREAGVSRNTAEEAYAQLEREGYVNRRGGAGSFVAERLTIARPQGKRATPAAGAGRRGELSARGRIIAASRACLDPTISLPFAAGHPALEAFPLEQWHRLVVRHSRAADPTSLIYGHPAGHEKLRQAVAEYVTNARGVVCDASQVLILSSSQQALDLSARMLVDPGDKVWIEEPGYAGAAAAFRGAGADLVPVPVDDDGLNVAAGIAAAPRARLIYVTPSHQYPSGVTLSLDRRLALLDHARQSGAWIIEDDYDSEFRYSGRPLASIQGLDTSGRVLYIGTFTKVMFPSLRLAYMVLPRDLVESFVLARTQIDGHPPTFPQLVLADFITEGHFGTHIRRMRTLYGTRREVFVETATKELGGALRLTPAEAGLHITGFLPKKASDREVVRKGAGVGLDLTPLSRFYVHPATQPGLVLGYAALTPAQIRSGIQALARCI